MINDNGNKLPENVGFAAGGVVSTNSAKDGLVPIVMADRTCYMPSYVAQHYRQIAHLETCLPGQDCVCYTEKYTITRWADSDPTSL